uniref:Uncharacterized protein n=1 Tax=Tanacetum cinerariifolium TaxID=118510 RepID=A0A6L2KGW0_TANCI|nr:hypothetical protein [Tanacetum cinerariifolium]
MDENQLIKVIEVYKQIDLNKQVIKQENELESYAHDDLPEVADPQNVAQKITAGSESCPPMLNKENYVPWSSRLFRYAKSIPNGKLIHNSILNGPYVRKMILEPVVKLLKKSGYESMMKGSDIGIQEKKAKLFNEWERQIQMVGGNGGNQFRQYVGNPAGYNDVIGNQVIQNAVQNPRVQNVGNQNGLIGVQGNGNQNQIGNGNLAQHEEAGIQLQAEKYDLMAAAADLDEIEKVNANCILMANLQQASTSEEHYTELLEPIPELHQVPHNNNDVISEDTGVEQGGETVEQHPANFEETRALYESLYQNLAIEVEKVNPVNRKLKETNVDMTTELARYKNQERCFEISQEKYDKLERCYQHSVYQEQCLSKNINALHLSSDELLYKQILLEKRIKELNNIVLKTGQSIQTIHMLSPKPNSFYHTEQKMALGYQNPFYLKQAQKKQQCLYDGKVLLEKHDHPIVHDSEETLQLAQESRDKMKKINKEIKPVNYTKINHLSGVFVPQTALSREELYFSNNSKTANVSKSFLIPNEDLLDDTTPSVARKFLNKVKSTILTFQRVVKQRMTTETHNWASSAHQELHKIEENEIFLSFNQVDVRFKIFEIQFLKEAAKFVGDFKSLANEADASLAKHKALELEIERLLKAVFS